MVAAIIMGTGWTPIYLNAILIVPGTTPTVIKRSGVTLLILRVRRIKQFVEVEILKNFPSLLLVLLALEVLGPIRSLTALMASFFVRTDSFTNETIILLVEVERV